MRARDVTAGMTAVLRVPGGLLAEARVVQVVDAGPTPRILVPDRIGTVRIRASDLVSVEEHRADVDAAADLQDRVGAALAGLLAEHDVLVAVPDSPDGDWTLPVGALAILLKLPHAR